ncbi:MAG TPA: hypothetical protein VIM58_03145, partial [Candidatus Methylacidiphilales bacterium]
MGETPNHKELKRLALEWAREQGYAWTAPEVSFPHRRCRADVAACIPAHRTPPKKPITAILAAAAIFECKQARADFRKDHHAKAATAAKLEELLARRAKLEESLQLHLPHLARGEALFPAFDAYNYEGHAHAPYRKVLKAIEVAQAALAAGTKFDNVFRWKMANVHYVVTEPKIW